MTRRSIFSVMFGRETTDAILIDLERCHLEQARTKLAISAEIEGHVNQLEVMPNYECT